MKVYFSDTSKDYIADKGWPGAAYAPAAAKQIQSEKVKMAVITLIDLDFFFNSIIAPNLSFSCSAPSVKVTDVKELLY